MLPLTPGRWGDLQRLFGPRGACAGCWCMYPRVTRAEFTRGKGEGNRRALARLVRGGTVPGVLAYAGREVVGWCAIEPRAAYPTLDRSRILFPVDDQPVWSIVCFFVDRVHRGRGVSRALIEGAVAHARRHRARVVEAYPMEARKRTADVFAWWGVASAFRRAGFTEVARRSPTRPIMRRLLRAAGARA